MKIISAIEEPTVIAKILAHQPSSPRNPRLVFKDEAINLGIDPGILGWHADRGCWFRIPLQRLRSEYRD